MKQIALIPGDGIGSDITREAKVLDAIAKNFTSLIMKCSLVELQSMRLVATSKESLEAALQVMRFYSVQLAVQNDSLPGSQRPEQALMGLRSGMKVYANLRPAYCLNN